MVYLYLKFKKNEKKQKKKFFQPDNILWGKMWKVKKNKTYNHIHSYSLYIETASYVPEQKNKNTAHKDHFSNKLKGVTQKNQQKTLKIGIFNTWWHLIKDKSEGYCPNDKLPSKAATNETMQQTADSQHGKYNICFQVKSHFLKKLNKIKKNSVRT